MEPDMDTYYENSLDQLIAPGLRLWMLLAMIFGILLFMVMVVCCFMKIRIPRTKREIEMMTAKRERRKGRRARNHRPSVFQDGETGSRSRSRERAEALVVANASLEMDHLRPPNHHSDAESYTSSALTSDEDRTPTPNHTAI